MAGRVQSRQLAFVLPHMESLRRDDFLEGPSNETALSLVNHWPDWPNRIMMLVGPEGCGKSHLAAIWAEQAGARAINAQTLIEATVPDALTTGALVIEDLAPGKFDECALFHLMNMAKEEEAYVLMTGRQAPAAFAVELLDLNSRLRMIPIVAVSSADDQLFRALIVKFGADRQMSMDEAVVSYLVTRIERSVRAARQAIARLDEESLRLRRPVTRALAVDVLREDD